MVKNGGIIRTSSVLNVPSFRGLKTRVGTSSRMTRRKFPGSVAPRPEMESPPRPADFNQAGLAARSAAIRGLVFDSRRVADRDGSPNRAGNYTDETRRRVNCRILPVDSKHFVDSNFRPTRSFRASSFHFFRTLSRTKSCS